LKNPALLRKGKHHLILLTFRNLFFFLETLNKFKGCLLWKFCPKPPNSKINEKINPDLLQSSQLNDIKKALDEINRLAQHLNWKIALEKRAKAEEMRREKQIEAQVRKKAEEESEKLRVRNEKERQKLKVLDDLSLLFSTRFF